MNLIRIFHADTLRKLRVAVNTVLENLILVTKTIRRFDI